MADELLYRQIAKTLEDGILSGAYVDDGPVPSTNQFARLFAINPATAAKGVNELVDAGILYKKRGLGMYVCPGARARLARERREAFERETVGAFVREARRLGITREALIALIAEYNEEERHADSAEA